MTATFDAPCESCDQRPPVAAMAAGTGLAVASIYYNQPMLALIAREFPGGHAAGLIPTLTQLGYALGLLFLVPLGDLFERRRLIVLQFLALASILALTALAPDLSGLALASLALGMAATAAQQIVPLAAHLAPSARRGAVVGAVMSGLLTGILLSRTAAGFLADLWGWRAIYALAAPLALIMALVLFRALPRSRPDRPGGYRAVMGSLIGLWCELPALRRAAITQALLFAGFSAFWTVLALYLETPRFGLGAAVAGLFGVVGLAGVLAAPLAGRSADRIGPEAVVAAAAGVVLAAWLVMGFWGALPGLVLGVVAMDFGVQSALVSNQHIIYSLRPEARARLNTLFMTVMFLGGAAGSAAASLAWHHWAWHGVAGLGLALSFAAGVVQWRGRRAA